MHGGCGYKRPRDIKVEANWSVNVDRFDSAGRVLHSASGLGVSLAAAARARLRVKATVILCERAGGLAIVGAAAAASSPRWSFVCIGLGRWCCGCCKDESRSARARVGVAGAIHGPLNTVDQTERLGALVRQQLDLDATTRDTILY